MTFATHLVMYGMKCLKEDVAILVIYNKIGGGNGGFDVLEVSGDKKKDHNGKLREISITTSDNKQFVLNIKEKN